MRDSTSSGVMPGALMMSLTWVVETSGKGVDRQAVPGGDAGADQEQRGNQHQQALGEGKLDQAGKHVRVSAAGATGWRSGFVWSCGSAHLAALTPCRYPASWP
jgi:hypothetical protein